MKCTRFMLALAILAASSANGQDLLLKKAPPLTMKAILQAPGKKLKEKDLAGKVIVLEFWATWCTPCMANVAHLNALSKHFAKSDVRFISITDEQEDKISHFLQKRKMNSWIGIDSNGTTFKSYGVTGIPATFVIDTEGIIKYAGAPQHLNEQIINGILSGKYQPEKVKIKDTEPILGGWGGGDDPVYTAHFKAKYLFQQTIRPSVMGQSAGTAYRQWKGQVGVSLLGQNLRSVIASIYDLSSSGRVINLSEVPDSSTWDVIFSRNKGYDLSRAHHELAISVQEAFSIVIKDTGIMTAVLIPAYGPSQKIMNESSIDFDKPESHTYHPIKEIFDKMETKTGQVVDYPDGADSSYVDIFPVLPLYYSMTGAEIKAWLEKEGVIFREEKKAVPMKVLHNSSL